MKTKLSAIKVFLIIILLIDIIALIPSPVIYIASMMSAAGGNGINFKDFHELLIRFLWILSAYYPVYIILPYIFGRNFLLKKNNKIGYFLCILSAILALAVIGILLFIFLK